MGKEQTIIKNEVQRCWIPMFAGTTNNVYEPVELKGHNATDTDGGSVNNAGADICRTQKRGLM